MRKIDRPHLIGRILGLFEVHDPDIILAEELCDLFEEYLNNVIAIEEIKAAKMAKWGE